MQKKIVSTDIDEVLRSFVDSLQKVYAELYPHDWMKPVTAYKLDPFFELGDRIFNFYAKDYPQLVFMCAEVMQGADTFTEDISAMGHQVILNSSQPNPMCDELAIAWINENSVYYDGIVLSQDKSLIRPDIHLDDATHHLQRLRDRGIRAVAFDRPWNQDWDGERVKTHQEFIELCKQL